MGKSEGKSGKSGNRGNQAKSGKLGKGEYLEKLAPLQVQLNDVARWLQHTGQRLLVVIEGRDTAGKGGVIAAIRRLRTPPSCA